MSTNPTSVMRLHSTPPNTFHYGRGIPWEIRVTDNSRYDIRAFYWQMRRAGLDRAYARARILTMLHIGWMANAHRRTDRWAP